MPAWIQVVEYFIICVGTYKTIEGSVANVLGQLAAATIFYFIGKHVAFVGKHIRCE